MRTEFVYCCGGSPTESMMILSESVSTALNQTQQTLTRVNNSLDKTTTALNSAKNIIDQQAIKLEEQQKAAQILNRVKKQYNKESIKTYTKSSFNRGNNTFSGSSISRIFDHAETANAATNQFRLKCRSSINSRSAKIEEMRNRLEIRKSIVITNNKAIITHDEVKRKTAPSINHENIFKSKLKMKISKLQHQRIEQNIENQVIKPK